MAKPLKSERIISPVGQIVQVHLDESVEDVFNNDKKEYNGKFYHTFQVEIAFPKDKKETTLFIKQVVAEEKKLLATAFGATFKPLHKVVRDSAEMSQSYVPENTYLIRAKVSVPENRKCPIKLQDKFSDLYDDGRAFYAGCWGRMQFILQTYDYKAKGVRAKPLTLQFAKDDDPIVFGTGGESLGSIADEYDALTDKADEESLLG